MNGVSNIEVFKQRSEGVPTTKRIVLVSTCLVVNTLHNTEFMDSWKPSIMVEFRAASFQIAQVNTYKISFCRVKIFAFKKFGFISYFSLKYRGFQSALRTPGNLPGTYQVIHQVL